MNELLWKSEAENLELWRVALKDCKEQDVNAQVMPPDMLERIAATIKRDKRLESIPFAVKRGGVFEIISGHHRVRAAHMAGMKDILMLADTTDMPRSAVVAKQIAHNALVGEPDPAVVLQMFEEIDNLEDALEAYIEPELLQSMLEDERPLDPERVDVEEDWRSVMLVFLNEHMVTFENVLTRLNGQEDMIGLVSIEQFKLFQSTVERISRKTKVTNAGAAVVAMCRIVLNAIGDEGNGK